MNYFKKEWIGILIVATIIADASAIGFYRSSQHVVLTPATYKTLAEADVYVRFDMEAYDAIGTNYWQKPTDSGMAQLYQQSIEKTLSLLNVATSTTLATQDRTGTANLLARVMNTATSTVAKRQLATTILQVVLYNLAPAGRDELLSQEQQKELVQEVTNVKPGQNLYGDIGAASGSSTAEVNTAYAKKQAVLAASSSPAAVQALAAATYAHKVLTNSADKVRYDTSGIQPTIYSITMGRTLYIYISKMSPTTLAEFQESVDAASSTPGLDSMIIDVRGNLGGSLQDAATIIGYFQGQMQFAFDLFHQGDYNVVRSDATKLPGLARFRDVALLTDNMTQSTAEVITAAFKRFHLGTVVGGTTRGWGTVENTYPLLTPIDPSTMYALLLVNSITLRDDNQPIQGAGVNADVNIADAHWQLKLPTYIRSQSLIDALIQEAPKKPIQ